MRTAAYARRKQAHARGQGAQALVRLQGWLAARPQLRRVSAYAPIRTELDVLPLLPILHDAGVELCLPVVVGPEQPLLFRRWAPGCAMIDGAFGARIPEDATQVVPDGLIVPLLAFDRRGYRLGYGGGFYDRTLEKLRASGPVSAVGLGYAAQEVASVPVELTDAALEAIVTETEVIEIA